MKQDHSLGRAVLVMALLAVNACPVRSATSTVHKNPFGVLPARGEGQFTLVNGAPPPESLLVPSEDIVAAHNLSAPMIRTNIELKCWMHLAYPNQYPFDQSLEDI